MNEQVDRPPGSVDTDVSYDAIVVGARVAGCVVASELADAGHRVLLADRARFPSTTISTHFFRGAGLVGVLDQIGALDNVLALGPPKLVREWMYFEGKREEHPPQDPGEIGYCLSVRREPLDAVLLEHAGATGAEVRSGAAVDSLVSEDGRIAGVRFADGVEARARIVIGADGRHSTIARLVDATLEESDPPFRALYYRYVRDWRGPDGETPDAAEFSFTETEIAYAFPSDAGLTCVAITIPIESFDRFRSSVEERFDEHLAGHPDIAVRASKCEAVTRVVGGGPEPNWIRRAWGPGWALVGDAGQHQDPWTGLGMDCASVHATYLADALGSWFVGDTTEEDALDGYARRREEHGMQRYVQSVPAARARKGLD